MQKVWFYFDSNKISYKSWFTQNKDCTPNEKSIFQKSMKLVKKSCDDPQWIHI